MAGTLTSGSADKTVKFWKAHTSNLLRTLDEHDNRVSCVAFDRNGGMLATGSDDYTVELRRARSGKLLRVSFEADAVDPEHQGPGDSEGHAPYSPDEAESKPE